MSKINMTVDQKLEIDRLIQSGEDEKAMLLVKKYATVNEPEAKNYVVSRRSQMVNPQNEVNNK